MKNIIVGQKRAVNKQARSSEDKGSGLNYHVTS